MKRKACMIIALLVAVITAANVAYMIKDEFYYKLDDLPEGVKLGTLVNTQVLFEEHYFIEVYEIPATQKHPAAIRAVLCNDQTHESRTIYWQIGTRACITNWDEADTIIINDVPISYYPSGDATKPIDQKSSSYDCRDYPNFKYVPKEE